jgi:hypothetical protein
MAQKEAHTERTEKSLPDLIPAEFAAMGKKRFDELVAMQTERLEKLQEANRNWFDRMQAEVTLASEFVGKLTVAHSIPEAATAYQEWTSRHMEMATEDAKRIFADGQKLAETGARLFFNGWWSNGRDGGST